MQLIVENYILFGNGLAWTFGLAVLTLVFATVISLFVGIMSITRNRLLTVAARIYVEVFRDIPLLVSLFFIYFGAPLIGLPLDPFSAAVVTLSLWGGANGAEIVRGGFNAIPEHQRTSAAALGLKPWQIYWYVIAPQALLPIIPPFTGLFTLLVQSTSLAALIGVPELFRMAQIVVERTTIMEGYSPAFTIFGAILVVYYLISAALNALTSRLERAMQHRLKARGAADMGSVRRQAEESV